MTVRFLLDGDVIETDAAATDSVLDLIRYRLRRTGTKEGCAEGDCGACTILVGERAEAGIAWRAVNACILFVPMLDGKAVMTVESLAGAAPIQSEMVARHGSQCGFCTPGIVMALHARSLGAKGMDVPVGDALSGNLCRCTGYGPILAAGDAVAPATHDDAQTVALLNSLYPSAPYPGEGRGPDSAQSAECASVHDSSEGLDPGLRRGTAPQDWVAPATTDALAALLFAHPETRLVAGATDVGLWVTKQHRALGPVAFIADIPDLRAIDESDTALTLGAAVRYVDADTALTRLHPELGRLVRRIGGVQVRSSGTIGGNIANGSPIGDMPPALIALGAMLTLRRGDTRRTLALEDYFLSYGKQDRQPGEFVESVTIPRPAPEALIRLTKISKRFDSDISAVMAAFALTIEHGTVTAARIAFGGMAGTPKRAAATEATLIGQPWSEATIERAARALASDYAPLDDLRASAAYRLKVAANLLRRVWIEASGEPVDLFADAL